MAHGLFHALQGTTALVGAFGGLPGHIGHFVHGLDEFLGRGRDFRDCGLDFVGGGGLLRGGGFLLLGGGGDLRGGRGHLDAGLLDARHQCIEAVDHLLDTGGQFRNHILIAVHHDLSGEIAIGGHFHHIQHQFHLATDVLGRLAFPLDGFLHRQGQVVETPGESMQLFEGVGVDCARVVATADPLHVPGQAVQGDEDEAVEHEYRNEQADDGDPCKGQGRGPLHAFGLSQQVRHVFQEGQLQGHIRIDRGDGEMDRQGGVTALMPLLGSVEYGAAGTADLQGRTHGTLQYLQGLHRVDHQLQIGMGLRTADGHQRRVARTLGCVPQPTQGLQALLAVTFPGLLGEEVGEWLREAVLWRGAFQHQIEIQVVETQVAQSQRHRGVLLYREHILEFEPHLLQLFGAGRLLHQLADQAIQAVVLHLQAQARGFHVQFRQQVVGGDLDDPQQGASLGVQGRFPELQPGEEGQHDGQQAQAQQDADGEDFQ